jgi:hypothetical protein
MLVGGEVKKARRELEAMLEHMRRYAADPELPGPSKGVRRNAFKKVASIRNNRPSLFWAVGPEGHSQLFEVIWRGEEGAFAFQGAPNTRLTYRAPA